MVSIIVLFPKKEIARNIRNLLVKSGFDVTVVCVTGSQVIQRMEGLEEGLIVCGYRCADMIYSELLEYLPTGFRMLLLASQSCLDECDDKDVCHLVMPLKTYELIEKVRLIVNEIQAGRKKRRQRPKQRSREELELLEEVKQLLMENNRISEQEAHSYIQQRSMNSGVGLMEMAKMIKESLTYQN